MGKVAADFATSLDGFFAGTGDRPDRGLGERGECLRCWVPLDPRDRCQN